MEILKTPFKGGKEDLRGRVEYYKKGFNNFNFLKTFHCYFSKSKGFEKRKERRVLCSCFF